ncbi:AraC family transcriptional regulator [Mycolicibacterium smegmatis]|uniref:AraC family transcriptional regulator n=1 Tax=Mycolicibacterium smegmatis TaxID=1772 RepID=UPI0020A4C41E|nr:AraC family transcriptional regulator [Mycolicibacterium smegmatis]MCP2626805.1 AraC family transcriptional regulator [Mycolicibacterium smegmatis]
MVGPLDPGHDCQAEFGSCSPAPAVGSQPTGGSTTTLTIAAVARTAGFNDPLYFSRQFTKVHGLSPAAYRPDTRTELGSTFGALRVGVIEIESGYERVSAGVVV